MSLGAVSKRRGRPRPALVAGVIVVALVSVLGLIAARPNAIQVRPETVHAHSAGFRTRATLSMLAQDGGPGAMGRTVEPVIARCPTPGEVALVDAHILMRFETNLTGPALACTKAQGSMDLTALQKRAYQAVLMMRRLQFSRPLPWTDGDLFTWFTTKVDGIRFRSDIEFSFCCDPERVININVATNSYIYLTDRWISLDLGGGLEATMVLLVHEARHIEVGGHTCGGDDNTVDELNSWGIQYYLYRWLAAYADSSFLTDPGLPPGAYEQLMALDASRTLMVRFCKDTTTAFE